jgi:hypothetical protein
VKDLGKGQLIFDIARIHGSDCTGLPRKSLLLSRAAEVLVIKSGYNALSREGESLSIPGH